MGQPSFPASFASVAVIAALSAFAAGTDGTSVKGREDGWNKKETISLGHIATC